MVIELTRENRFNYITQEAEQELNRIIVEYCAPQMKESEIGDILMGGFLERNFLRRDEHYCHLWVEFRCRKDSESIFVAGPYYAVMYDGDMPDLVLDRYNAIRGSVIDPVTASSEKAKKEGYMTEDDIPADVLQHVKDLVNEGKIIALPTRKPDGDETNSDLNERNEQ